MSAPTLRTGVPDADLAASAGLDWSWFLKLTVGGAYGTKRYTDQPRTAGVDGFTGNIDGTSQTWNTRYLGCPGFNQDNAGIESVQYIDVANGDFELSTISADVGLLDVPYELYWMWFAADGVTVDGGFMATGGLVDDVMNDLMCRLTLKANNTYWARRVLGPPMGPLCPFYFKDSDTCQSLSVNTTCDKTRSTTSGCGVGFNNNLGHFGGLDLALPPGTIIYWQHVQITTGPQPSSANPPPSGSTPSPVTPPPARTGRNPGQRIIPPRIRTRPSTPTPVHGPDYHTPEQHKILPKRPKKPPGGGSHKPGDGDGHGGKKN